MKGSPKNVADEGRERSTKFFIVAFGSLDTNITFLILEARICLGLHSNTGSRRIYTLN